MRKKITASWEGQQFRLTDKMITAIENLMKAEILMMREVHKDTADYWYFGAAKINDMCVSNWLETTFGGEEDAESIKEGADIFVTVPF